MPATQNIEVAKGYDVSGAITKMRFVKEIAGSPQTVAQCDTLGERAVGVSMFSVSDAEILRGKGASVILDGIAILESNGAVPEFSLVTTDAVGRAIVAVSGNWILGVCREASSGTGNQCSIILADGISTLA